ncbi:MAG TPA: PLP-dependent aminotransferase family protein [Burkholderiaceae bacterium]
MTPQLAAIRLDPALPAPLYRQLYDALKQGILSGALEAGTQLPPTRDFCQLLAISRQTVLNAYAQLTAEGYLDGAVGKGTFISAGLARPLAPDHATKSVASSFLPLSPRGARYADAMGSTRYHERQPRAFMLGMPGVDLFPFDIWGRLEARAARRPAHRTGYADPAGYLPLRELLAVYLKASRGVQCSANDILITSGSQQGLYMLASMLLEDGDAAWVENPGYRGAYGPLHACGARIAPIPLDEHGLSVQHGAAACPEARLIYVTPSHQMPTGVTMSLQRRLELLSWATTHRAWIIEDDYDSEYRYTGPPLASLQSLDRAGCVIYVGTLSKVLFPGLRLGFLVAPPALMAPLVAAKAVMDRHTAVAPQMVLADFMAEGHFGRHIKRTRVAYAERRAALLDAVRDKLAPYVRLGPADAGLDVCVYFTRPYEELAVARAAAQRGVDVRPLSYYASNLVRNDLSAGLVLGFSATPPEQIRQAVDILKTVLQEMA